MWFSYGGKNRQMLEALVARFNASQPAISIHATFQGDYFENLTKLRSAIAAKSAPTITHVVSEVIPYLAEADVLEPLSEYAGAKDLDLVPALDQRGTWIGGASKPLMALPFNRSTPILYTNQEMLDAAGLKAPTTWDELKQAARTLKRGTGNDTVWGLICPISWWFWAALVQQAGGTVVEADGTPTLGGEAGVRALDLWQDMVHRDHTMRPPPGRDYNAWEVTNGDFLAKRAAMIYTSTAFVRYIDQNAKFKAVAAPLPRDVKAAVPTGGTFFIMLKDAPREQKQAAWEFLRWMAEPQQTIEWATGTGYMPIARKAVLQLEANGYYQTHPNDRVAMDQLAHAVPWPWAPNLFRVQRECIDPLIEEAVLVPRNSREVLEQARRRAAED
ncbi:MAG: ABC transporter substrate-binding protein [Deltaproteobacteria bacterium]|nr:ABC transporter substrate-binding protein [Deltaproteobacteria bacterium]